MRRLAPALLLLFGLGLTACGEKVPSPPPVTEEETASAPLPHPDTSGRGRWVQIQIAERQAWQERVSSSPRSSPQDLAAAVGELGRLYHAHEFLAEAEVCYRRAEDLAPEDPRWPYYLGQLYRARNEPDESIAALRRAAELESSNVPALVRLGEVLLDANRVEEARAALERVVEMAPETAAAHAALGRIAARSGDPAAARDHFREALELQPEASRLRYGLGLALRDLGREEEAQEELSRAGEKEVALDDPLMLVLYGLTTGLRQASARGAEALERGDSSAAVEAYREAVAADPLFSLSRVELARALLAAGRTDEAEERIAEALKLDPESPEANFLLGYLRDQEGEVVAALEHYRRAAAGDERTPPGLHYNLARLLRLQGELEEAVREYHLALERVPKNRLAWLGLASALQGLGRCAEAMEEVGHGLEALPRDGGLGQAQARLLAACPDPETLDGERALLISQSLYSAQQSPPHAEAVAMSLARLGRLEEAVTWQRRALEGARRAGAPPELLSQFVDRLTLFESGQAADSPWSADDMRIFGAVSR